MPPAFPAEPYVPWVLPRKRFQDRVWLHVLLLVLTLGTTTLVGALYSASFISDIGRHEVRMSWGLVVSGLWYSLTVVGILGAHEMGHYLACRYYQVDASLPFFIPILFPFVNLPQTGTLGAVIRIREPFPTKAVLFDIGVAGPIAGFVVLLPALFAGLFMSKVTGADITAPAVSFGDSLLIQGVTRIVWGTLPAGSTLNCHPMFFAAWFGMFATALNLLPFGQLDGGHVSYAALGRYSTAVSVVTLATALGLTYYSPSWTGMTTMMFVMILLFGVRHPRVIDEHEPLSGGRKLTAILALIIFVLCFMPAPLEELAPVVRP